MPGTNSFGSPGGLEQFIGGLVGQEQAKLGGSRLGSGRSRGEGGGGGAGLGKLNELLATLFTLQDRRFRFGSQEASLAGLSKGLGGSSSAQGFKVGGGF